MARQGQPNSLDSMMMAYANLSGPSKASSFKGPALKDVKVSKAETTGFKPSTKARDWSSLSQNLEDAFSESGGQRPAGKPALPTLANPLILPQQTLPAFTAGVAVQRKTPSEPLDDWGDFQSAASQAFPAPVNGVSSSNHNSTPAQNVDEEDDFADFVSSSSNSLPPVIPAPKSKALPPVLPAPKQVPGPPTSRKSDLPKPLSNITGLNTFVAPPQAVESKIPTVPNTAPPAPAPSLQADADFANFQSGPRSTPVMPAAVLPPSQASNSSDRYSNLRDVFSSLVEEPVTQEPIELPTEEPPSQTASSPLHNDQNQDDFGDFVESTVPAEGPVFPTVSSIPQLPAFATPAVKPGLPNPMDTTKLGQQLTNYSEQFGHGFDQPKSNPSVASAQDDLASVFETMTSQSQAGPSNALDLKNFASGIPTTSLPFDANPSSGQEDLGNFALDGFKTSPPLHTGTPVDQDLNSFSLDHTTAVPTIYNAVKPPTVDSVFMPQHPVAGVGVVPWLADRPPAPPADLPDVGDEEDGLDDDPAGVSTLTAIDDEEEDVVDPETMTKVKKQQQQTAETPVDTTSPALSATANVSLGLDPTTMDTTAALSLEPARKSSDASGHSLHLSENESIQPERSEEGGEEDRYRSLYELSSASNAVDSDSPFHEWKRVLDRIHGALTSTLQTLEELGKDQEEGGGIETYADCPEMIEHLLGLREMHLVGLRIASSHERRRGRRRPDVDDRLSAVRNLWSGRLAEMLRGSKIGDEIFADIPVQALCENGKRCGICLCDLGSPPAPAEGSDLNAAVISSPEGGSYHAPCGNLWANLIEPTLPNLTALTYTYDNQ